MPMTNATMAPSVPPAHTPAPKLSVEQLKQAANLVEDPLAGVAEAFDAKVRAESQPAPVEQQTLTAKPISDLIESDAYDFSIPINASVAYNADSLKIVLKDPNYIARWCHRNEMRQTQVIGRGFRVIQKDEVANFATLEPFLDSQEHFVSMDLVAMKIRKDVYYAGLRAAMVKSLHASNAKKAAEAGAQHATTNLTGSLSAGERNYLQQHQDKPIYNPNIGV